MVKGGGTNKNYESYRGICERKHVKWANKGNIRRTDKSAKRNIG